MEQLNVDLSKGMEVLIIEDSPTQAAKLRYILGKYGFTVSVAGNGAEALSMLAVKTPSLVITDVIMPDMDGFEVCSAIRDDERTRNIPVILLTSLSDSSDVIKGLKCGADSFISKPFDETHLISQIRYIFANTSLREQKQSQLGVEIVLAGERHVIKSDPLRMFSFLFYSYETAIEKNRELTKVGDELRYLSTHDILTGLYNRTFFEEELKRLSSGRRFPIGVFSADVDGLKLVNDSLGHEAGDRLLRLVAGALSGAFRSDDVVARIGGDEFVVLLPGADAQVVDESIKRVRSRLQEVNATVTEFEVGISIGAATAQTAEEVLTALKSSDERMYRDKFIRKGKNWSHGTAFA